MLSAPTPSRESIDKACVCRHCALPLRARRFCGQLDRILSNVDTEDTASAAASSCKVNCPTGPKTYYDDRFSELKGPIGVRPA